MTLPTLSSIIESDMTELYDTNEGAVAVDYYVRDAGTTTSISVFAAFDADLANTQSGLAAYMTFWIRKADVSSPSIYDSIAYDGNDYQIMAIIGGNKHSWQVSAKSDLRQVPSGLRG